MGAFSSRSQVREDINAITRALTRVHTDPRAAAELLDLTESNPTRANLAWEPELLNQALHDAHNATYTPDAFGLRSAREALAREFAGRGFAVPPEQIMLTASTSEAYGHLFKLLCDPGDDVLVPSPSYPLFDMLAQFEGVQLRPYALGYDGEWHVDGARLRALRSSRTRAILTVHPNNPTGSFLKRAELANLVELGLPIVSDEVFADYAYAPDPARAESALEAASTNLVFCMGGLSKSLALPQLKLAWTAIAGPEDQVQEACRRLSHVADAYLSPNTPVQLALPRLLAGGAAMRARLHARLAENRAELARQLEQQPAVRTLHAEGGWYAILRLPAVLDEEAWVLRLLTEDGVLVQPGFFYDFTQGAHLVLSLITPPQIFQTGVQRLLNRVAQEIAD